MSRKRKASGRSSSPFVMLHWMILDSQGWHDLSSYARLAYPEIVRKWRGPGSNNGQARDLALRIGCGKSTAARALTELEDAGFIRCMKVGTFKRKDRHASEYRINIYRCDVTGDTPDRAWNNSTWQPPPDGPISGTVRCHLEHGPGTTPPTPSHQRDRDTQNRPPHGPTGGTHLDIYQGKEALSTLQGKARRRAGIKG